MCECKDEKTCKMERVNSVCKAFMREQSCMIHEIENVQMPGLLNDKKNMYLYDELLEYL
jgi:hypothetical protein